MVLFLEGLPLFRFFFFWFVVSLLLLLLDPCADFCLSGLSAPAVVMVVPRVTKVLLVAMIVVGGGGGGDRFCGDGDCCGC